MKIRWIKRYKVGQRVPEDGKKYYCFHGDILDFVIMKARWLAVIGGWSYDFIIRLNTIYNFIRNEVNITYSIDSFIC